MIKPFASIAAFCFATHSGTAIGMCQDLQPVRSVHDSVGYAIHDFERALHYWQTGLLGGVLFYHRADGPLSWELSAMNEGHPEAPVRLPEQWKWQCMRCNGRGECDATISVRFSGEKVMSLRRYKLVLTPGAFWGLHSETQVEDSPGMRDKLQACWQALQKRRKERPETWWTE